jgi:uncharacterized damage-inducible protein DinB
LSRAHGEDPIGYDGRVIDGSEAADELARVLEGDAEGEAFHGPALAAVLRDVGPAEAVRRPIAGVHTIAEILAHVVAWREWIAARLEGTRVPNPPGDGWAPSGDEDPEGWVALRARLASSQARLSAALRALDAEGLAPHRDLWRFALHHELHHLGQVSLVRRAACAAKDGR